VRFFLLIILLIIFVKFQFLISLVVFSISAFVNFYIGSGNVPFEEFFFDVKISNDLFLLDPRVHNISNYRIICESISSSYNARKSQWYLIEHLRKKFAYTAVFLGHLQMEYQYWFKAKCYNPFFFYIFYRLPYFKYYLLFSFFDSFFFFPIR
jgi:hypothetical protein